ncbi:IS66 family transposase [Cupriavidus consociatus]|uniref:IS66 family transposase n=1 Tax=Cupriavidus consociatus TaxID=2821357 RepID=UPI001AE26067|nr:MULTISPECIES: transposase [unclassified Cupriavidus]MBP0621024.1 transposase [Cupriavidus sp. LEh25]MDK2657693.1 transposase [Cupriavidus sp. LEh21]
MSGPDSCTCSDTRDLADEIIALLGGTGEDGNERCWQGTLVRDEYAAYDSALQANPGGIAAGCLAHARRRYDELLRNQGGSTVAAEALRRIAQIYRLERELTILRSEQRLARRHSDAKPLWEQLHAWLQPERSRVPGGSITASTTASRTGLR